MRSSDSSISLDDDEQVIAKGGVACPFPWRLHEMLLAATVEGMEDIVSWQPHGRSFLIHKKNVFVEQVMPRFFGQTKYASFQRQLNLYGFSRFSHGEDKGAYFHFAFVRGHRSLVREMVRRKVKGNKVRRPLLPSEEPNFYAPQWENYFGSTPPETINKPRCSSSSSIIGHPTTTVATRVPKQRLIKKIGNKILVDILPAPPVSSPPPPLKMVSPPVAPKAVVSNLVPRSPSPPNLTFSCASACSTSSSSSTTLQAPTAAWWDEYVEDNLFESDGDLLFFEGSPFHFLDDSSLTATTTPIVPQVCESGGHFPQNESCSSASVVAPLMHPNPSSLFAA